MSIDPKFVELTADVLEILLYSKIKGLLQTQATLCRFLYWAGSMLVTQLCKISSCIINSCTHATDELNSVHFREAKASFLFPIRTCLQRHVKTVCIQPYPMSYALLGITHTIQRAT